MVRSGAETRSARGRSGAGPVLVAAALLLADGRPAEAGDPAIHGVQEFRLANGLEVRLHEDRRVPIVAVSIRYAVGSRYDPDGMSGMAHLVEHLMFQGSEHAPGLFVSEIEALGGRADGTTSHDAIEFHDVVPAGALERVLWMEADRMAFTAPRLGDGRLDRQRRVVHNERRERGEGVPFAAAGPAIEAASWPEGHPYRRPVVGTPQDLDRIGERDLRAFLGTFLVPANARLVIAGDFDPAAARAWTERYFGDLPGGQRARLPGVPDPAPATSPIPKEVVADDDVTRTRVHVTFRAPPEGSPGDAELALLAAMLDRAAPPRLWEAFRERRLRVDDVGVEHASGECGGVFTVAVTLDPGTERGPVVNAVREALREIARRAPSREEVERARRPAETALALGLAGAPGIARYLSARPSLAGPAAGGHGAPGAPEPGPADLSSTAGRWLSSEPASVVVVRPRPAGRSSREDQR